MTQTPQVVNKKSKKDEAKYKKVQDIRLRQNSKRENNK